MNDRRDQIRTGVAWVVWTLAQVAWLGLMAQRVELSAKWPGAGEAWASVGTVAVQLVLACAMGRTLLRDVRSALSTIAVACPMLGLAVVMSGGRAVEAVPAMVCVAAWLGAIGSIGAISRAAVRGPLLGLMLVLSAGGPVMLYLAWEFGRRSVSADGLIAHFSPVLGAASTVSHGWGQISPILLPLLVILTVTVGRVVLSKRIKAQFTHVDGAGLKGLVG